jgi:hypothetical protein
MLLAFSCIAVFSWIRYHVPTPGNVLDEALVANRRAASFPAADEDYFRDMDRNMSPEGIAPAALTTEEIKGRNTWIVWTAGNDRMWDQLSVASFGALDLLKTLSTYEGGMRKFSDGHQEPALYNRRDNRWEYLGLVNEPCFEKSRSRDIRYRWGLRLDRRTNAAGCAPDPFENELKYPGVRLGARGRTLKWRETPSAPPIDVPLEIGSYYGFATGIVGLRLFPNPAFDQAAADHWDPERYYSDPVYYNDAKLVKPYRVGMSCGFCHVGPNPIRPPDKPNEPKWENLSSNVGAQYFWVDRILYWQQKPQDFAFQLFHSSRPGSLDTSFISTDNINNPRTMNAVYMLGPRLVQSTRWGQEALVGGSLHNRQFNDTVNAGPLAQFFKAPDVVWTPRVLKDGADSVGALGALNRVYLNIGTFSEEWLLHFNPFVGGRLVTPIEITTARRNSAYFAATESQTLDMARFFLKATAPHYLKDAPGGSAYMKEPQQDVDRGKLVFADNCARCHSNKLPPPPPTAKILEPDGCAGKDYLKCWNSYWEWTQTENFKTPMREIVTRSDFLIDNYLSSELRVPVTLLQTNACSPLATNAIGGNIWDNFSSQSYKDLPSVGNIIWYHPVTGEQKTYTMPAGGRGYTRPPSLISLWSTAPFLLNNSVGHFESSPSVDARMRSFEDSIEQMLWPEKRAQDSNPTVKARVKGPSLIDRVGDRLDAVTYDRYGSPAAATTGAYLTASAGFLPPFLQDFVATGAQFAPKFFTDDSIRLGPIPVGTPIGLLSNLSVLPDAPGERTIQKDRIRALLRQLLRQEGSDEATRRRWLQSVEFVDGLLALSKCPDLIVNRGHYFGTTLDDNQKHDLIAFLKTF